jgi:hypothetical protein
METSEYYNSVMYTIRDIPSSQPKSFVIENMDKFHQENKNIDVHQYIEKFNTEFKFIIELLIDKEKTKQLNLLEGVLDRVSTIEKIMIVLVSLQVIGVVGYVLYLLMK